MREPLGKVSNASGRGEGVFDVAEDFLTQIAQGFELDLPTLRSMRALRPGMRWQSSRPIWATSQMRFAPAASTAVADVGGAIGQIAEAGGGGGGELALVKKTTGGDEAPCLVAGATKGSGKDEVIFEAFGHGGVDSYSRRWFDGSD